MITGSGATTTRHDFPTSGVDYRLDRFVAVITFSNPPVNGLSRAVRSGLAAALERAQDDSGAQAVVLTGAGGLFSAGADVREFGTPASAAEPTLRQVIDRIERSAKPVVAAIVGTCLGGGLELALAAHYRVASVGAKLGLPEVKLGLIPGAGGTQRLPRLVGAERAIEMIVSGEPVPATVLAGTRLLDLVVDGDPVAAAVELAMSDGVRTQPPRRTRDLSPDEPDLAALCETARAKLKAERHPLPAPLRAVDAIDAAAGPFDEGLALERRAFLELMESRESKSLRHAFFAEREAAKVDGVGRDTPIRPLDRAAVVGAGAMGPVIAAALLDADTPAWIVEADRTGLERGVARVVSIYDERVKAGRLTPSERDRRLALLRPTLSCNDIAQADIVIEAVSESLEVKREVFQALDRVMKSGAILATSTSTLDLNAIAAFTRRPSDVLGLHFSGPAYAMRLLEVVRGRLTSAEVLATALALGKKLRKVAIVSGVCGGFIGKRMLDAYIRQARWLVEEGATPEQIDRVMEAFGFAAGPFRLGDFVDHDAGQITRPHRRAARRPIDDDEIADRLVCALVNEGAWILDEGIAARASDIDVVWITDYGFPRWRGGPMFHAEQVGFDRILRRVHDFARDPRGDPAFWTPAPLLERLARRRASP